MAEIELKIDGWLADHEYFHNEDLTIAIWTINNSYYGIGNYVQTLFSALWKKNHIVEILRLFRMLAGQ